MSKQAKSFIPYEGDGPLVDVVVGLPATYCIGSDQYAGVLTVVSNTGHKVTWTRVDCNGVKQENFNREFTWRAKQGEYKAKGSDYYGYLKLNHAKTILDPGF